MKLDDFYFELPEELIAQYPLDRREDARLLVVDRESGQLTHDTFKNIGDYLPSASQIILNNSRVVHARLMGTKVSTGANIEVFLLNKVIDKFHTKFLMKPMKRLKDGDQIVFPDEQVVAEVVDREKRIIRFNTENLTDFYSSMGTYRYHRILSEQMKSWIEHTIRPCTHPNRVLSLRRRLAYILQSRFCSN